MNRLAALLVASLCGAGCAAAGPSELPAGPSPCRQPTRVQVDAFIDGDTADVTLLDGDLAGAEERVRLLGIDTPEIDRANLADSDFCAVAAWDEAASLLDGETAWLTFDASCTDVYERTLAYLFRESDELWINEHLIAEGYARLSTFSFAFHDEFEALEATAQSQGRGMWGPCASSR